MFNTYGKLLIHQSFLGRRRRKVSDQRICSQIEASWDERIRKRKVEHETALERQTQFLDQIERSIEMLEERKGGAEEVRVETRGVK